MLRACTVRAVQHPEQHRCFQQQAFAHTHCQKATAARLQLWKTYRIASTETGSFSLKSVLQHRDAFTAVGVELGAGIGAWCFFFGTSLYDQGPLDGPDSVLIPVLWTWVAGSCFFTLGSLFLGFRHFSMRVV